MELQKDNPKDKGITPIQYDPDLFHNDQQFYLAYRKIEHIVSAIFLITGLIEKNDLLKASIQNHSLQCLAHFVTLIGKPDVGVADIQSVAAHVLHLNALLDIGFWSGQVSHMNVAILQREISATYQMLNDLSLKYKNTFYISSSFFKSDKELINDIKDRKGEAHQQKEIIASEVKIHKGQDKGHTIKDKPKGQKSLVISDLPKGQRREAILSLLRTHNNLTIKDFISVVPDCSEKTIQRELLVLVEEGIVRKEGERRWSTYSLAT